MSKFSPVFVDKLVISVGGTQEVGSPETNGIVSR